MRDILAHMYRYKRLVVRAEIHHKVVRGTTLFHKCVLDWISELSLCHDNRRKCLFG